MGCQEIFTFTSKMNPDIMRRTAYGVGVAGTTDNMDKDPEAADAAASQYLVRPGMQ